MLPSGETLGKATWSLSCTLRNNHTAEADGVGGKLASNYFVLGSKSVRKVS